MQPPLHVLFVACDHTLFDIACPVHRNEVIGSTDRGTCDSGAFLSFGERELLYRVGGSGGWREIGPVAGQPQGRPATINALLLHRGHLLWILCPGLTVVIRLPFRRVRV